MKVVDTPGCPYCDGLKAVREKFGDDFNGITRNNRRWIYRKSTPKRQPVTMNFSSSICDWDFGVREKTLPVLVKPMKVKKGQNRFKIGEIDSVYGVWWVKESGLEIPLTPVDILGKIRKSKISTFDIPSWYTVHKRNIVFYPPAPRAGKIIVKYSKYM